jgi:uncharacterized protein YndB with AHSA1/START domain
MSTVGASIVIAKPPAAVWETVMDPGRLGEWVTIHRALRDADPQAPHVGWRMEQRIHLRGVSMDIKWCLSECEPQRRAVWEGHGPARSRAHTQYTLHALPDGGTRFEYANEFHVPLGPIGALASRALVGGIPEREAQRTLERLRALMEG